MVSFTVVLKKFEDQGEKTGWTYIEISPELVARLKPGRKQSFRVKGFLDDYPIQQVSLLPMGGGGFIMAINAAMRKAIGKRQGAMVKLRLEPDEAAFKPDAELMACLEEEPAALAFYQSLAPGHQRYFDNWIRSAKTEPTKTKRIAMTIRAMERHQDYGAMIRESKANKL